MGQTPSHVRWQLPVWPLTTYITPPNPQSFLRSPPKMRRDTVPPRMAGGFKVWLVKYVKYWPWSHISSSMFWSQSLNDGVVILGSNDSYEVYDPLYGNPLGTKVLDIVFFINLIYVFSYFIFLCKKNKRNQDIYVFFLNFISFYVSDARSLVVQKVAEKKNMQWTLIKLMYFSTVT